MNDVKIGDHSGRAYILSSDLEDGREIVYFGEPSWGDYDCVKTDERMERNVEQVLTHESCHIAIYGITKSLRATIGMDYIDTPERDWLISGPYFAVGDKQ